MAVNLTSAGRFSRSERRKFHAQAVGTESRERLNGDFEAVELFLPSPGTVAAEAPPCMKYKRSSRRSSWMDSSTVVASSASAAIVGGFDLLRNPCGISSTLRINGKSP